MGGNEARESIDDATTRWLLAVHDAPHDAQLREGLAAWLAADPAHRAAYEETRRVWMLTGLLAPAANGDGARATDDPVERCSS
jgi:ferric-dicitrate binding protein FerR (iron transport regulator)